jgi:hypothetical protein
MADRKTEPDEYFNVTDHPITLQTGQPVAAGEGCVPDLDQPHDKAFVDEGALVKADKPKEEKAR